MKIALFIHRRDLRMSDNHAVYAAHKSGLPVLHCFILDPAQVSSTNEYRSKNAIQFMLNSLEDLSHQMHDTCLAIALLIHLVQIQV